VRLKSYPKRDLLVIYVRWHSEENWARRMAMRRKTHFSLRLLGLVTVLLIGTVTWTGGQGCEIQPGMSPEGWCCDGGNVAPCSEDECHS